MSTLPVLFHPTARRPSDPYVTRTFAAAASLLLCGLAVLAIRFFFFVPSTTTPPNPEDPSAWRWVAADAGANIYISRSRLHDALVSEWVERRFDHTSATIETSLFELWDIDCLRGMSRRVSRANRYRDRNGHDQFTTSSALSEWAPARRGTPDELIMVAACRHYRLPGAPCVGESAAPRKRFRVVPSLGQPIASAG